MTWPWNLLATSANHWMFLNPFYGTTDLTYTLQNIGVCVGGGGVDIIQTEGYGKI